MSDDEDFIVDELPGSRRKRRTAGGDCVSPAGSTNRPCCMISGVQLQGYCPAPDTRVHSPSLHGLQLGTLSQSGISP